MLLPVAPLRVKDFRVGRILFVDDDPLTRRVAQALLQRAGHEVFEAGSGLEALEMFDEVVPEVVVTDIMMPGMNGFELMAELRRRSKDVKLIAISGGSHGGADDPMLLLARDVGAAHALPKPIDLAALLAAVRSLT
jgi:two-component system, sensor histidine kinase and response regulator